MTDSERHTEDYEESEAKAVAAGKAAQSAMFRDRHVKKGLFAEVMRNDRVYPCHYMLRAVDGSGSKVILCSLMDNYVTEGQGLVAMCVNDIATFGDVILDSADIYFAVQSGVEEEKMGLIMQGIDSALKQCVVEGADININYGKLETASLDEMVTGPVSGYGFDMAMQLTAFIEKDKMPAFDPKPDDYIIGIASSGLHNNGYTAARHVLLHPVVEPRPEWKSQYRGQFSLSSPMPGTTNSIGQELLTPTSLYFRMMQKIARSSPGAFGVNITGYGLKNFNRFGSGVVYNLHDPMRPLPIHTLMVGEARYNSEEAYTKLNMGMGFAVIVKDETGARDTLMIAEEEGHKAKLVGRVMKGSGTDTMVLLHLQRGKEPVVFRGY